MTSFETIIVVMLLLQAFGWLIVMSGFLRGGGAIEDKPIRTSFFIVAVALAIISAMGGLGASIRGDFIPNYLPLLLGRTAGALLAWSIIALHWRDYLPFLDRFIGKKD